VEPGMELSSGSLNLEAPLVLEVSRVGSDTALARIIRLVEQAQARRAPIQGLADRVAGRFCYGVMALALATFLFWWLFGASHWPEVLQANAPGLPHAHGMVHGAQSHHSGLGSGATTPIGLALQLTIAVLVVACPCALGLATPTVITVSTGLAARRGWLFRGGDVIETAAALDQVVFDKTGTLTLGRPLVTDVFGDDPDRLLQWAASLEQSSRHPLAYALLQEAQRRDLALIDVTRVSTVSGEGLWGELDGVVGELRVGKPACLQSFGLSSPLLQRPGWPRLRDRWSRFRLDKVWSDYCTLKTSNGLMLPLHWRGSVVLASSSPSSVVTVKWPYVASESNWALSKLTLVGRCFLNRNSSVWSSSAKKVAWPWWATASMTHLLWPRLI